MSTPSSPPWYTFFASEVGNDGCSFDRSIDELHAHVYCLLMLSNKKQKKMVTIN